MATNATDGSQIVPGLDHFVPASRINFADGLKIKEHLDAGGPVKSHFQQTRIVEERTTQNVLVETFLLRLRPR
ncbi:uncharacterized protein GLRG_03161 [Colletotrichum graminicola M1.001]|uniref:Uncharacterized protein n=1 Tax=Colletotrichum graminicola (strain M1.001 / M2 / FGSC 10212) TaxID=645133 RepID=E3QAX9_COLGM|nr:uncharacterized protein GLRG_03161 [Colletotrichum graminicola M1.001]EFQ28017.1 hypothetical protein GLRG_03161 [Colletotrichum graminicola M1.001]